MEIFNNKFLVKLIASICLFLALFNVLGTCKVYAEFSISIGNNDDEEIWGSVLIKPIVRLLTGLADGIMEILQKSIKEQETTFIEVVDNTNWWDRWGKKALGIAIGLVIAVAGIVLAVYTGGASLAVTALGIGAVIKVCAVTVVGAAVAGYIMADNLDGTSLPSTIYLPMFSVTSEEIFSNELLLFDVNFFRPKYETTEKEVVVHTPLQDPSLQYTSTMDVYVGKGNLGGEGAWEVEYSGWEKAISNMEKIKTMEIDKTYEGMNYLLNDVASEAKSEGQMYFSVLKNEYAARDEKRLELFNYIIDNANMALEEKEYMKISVEGEYGVVIQGESGQGPIVMVNLETDENWDEDATQANGDNYHHKGSPAYKIGKIYFSSSPKGVKNKEDKQFVIIELKLEYNEIPTTTKKIIKETKLSTATQLSEVVSKMYFLLRNIAILVLLMVLIYSGIRIVIGSTAGEKAKHKERIIDWLVAMCLLFVMQYIMVFSITIVEKLTELIAESTTRGKMEMITLTETQKTNLEKYYPEIYNNYVAEGLDQDEKSVKRLMWSTDLVGAIKIQSQLEKTGTIAWVGGSIAYMVLVLFTVFFAWTYLKRVLYLAFLTIIAPFVAMTYPIDKINDGKAQAFNMWFREYIFNLLIQPMHLILYTVLVTAAYELAAQNIIYTLVAVGFMMPAEKLIRKFFGFEKAQTPGLLGGAAGAALAMTGLQGLMRGSNRAHSSSGGTDKEEKQKDIKYSNKGGTVGTDSMFKGESSSGKPPIKMGANAKGIGGVTKAPVRVVRGSKKSPVKAAGGAKKLPVKAAGGAKKLPVKLAGTGKNLAGKRRTSLEKLAAINQDGFWKRTGKTISGVSKAYARGLGNKALKRLQNGHPIRSLTRGAGKLFGGALLGGAGLALAIASGDPNKLAQYTSAGALGGAKLGGSVVDNAIDTVSVNDKNMGREMEMSWYGDEYKDVKYMEEVEEDLMSEENIGYIRAVKGCSRTEAKDFLDDTGRICYGEGVRDVEDMLAIQDVLDNQEEGEGMTLEQAIYATKLKNKLPQKMTAMSDKKLGEYQETYEKKYLEKIQELHPDWDETAQQDAAQQKAQQTIEYMAALDKAKSDLTDVKSE